MNQSKVQTKRGQAQGGAYAARTAGGIPLLAMHFLSSSARYSKRYSGITETEREMLKAYCWPGNIRNWPTWLSGP